MEARTWAITEAEEAGADLDPIRASAAHPKVSTTLRYPRGVVGKARTVAQKESALRPMDQA